MKQTCRSAREVGGLVGAIGTMLGEHGINIARLSLGRAPAAPDTTRQALSIVQTDSVVPPEVVDELRAIPGVLLARSAYV